MSLHITSTTKSVRVRPTTKDELKELIKLEVNLQGPDADLNFIDTSLIIDMTMLFWYTDIRNIKIDQWNTSNVVDMSYMATNCEKFNCDLSNWDTSKVTNMCSMFRGCENFNCDLSGWDVSSVVQYKDVFVWCPIDDSYKPKFKVYN